MLLRLCIAGSAAKLQFFRQLTMRLLAVYSASDTVLLATGRLLWWYCYCVHGSLPCTVGTIGITCSHIFSLRQAQANCIGVRAVEQNRSWTHIFTPPASSFFLPWDSKYIEPSDNICPRTLSTWHLHTHMRGNYLTYLPHIALAHELARAVKFHSTPHICLVAEARWLPEEAFLYI